jgi:hypothetical protein
MTVRCELDTIVRPQATPRFLCAALVCVAFSTTPAATVEWHYIGDPPIGSPPPSSFVTSPAAPVFGETISFVSPTDGKTYLNADFAADVCGDPLISVDSTNRLVTVTFTPPQHEAVPGPFFVSGINGQFEPLNVGPWGFQVFSNSGALIFSTNFTVAGPSLGVALNGQQVALSWPAMASNYVLQTATDLSTGSWSNITNAVTTTGTNYVFTNAMSGQAAYFRLKYQ